ncbi:MAG: amidase [Gammaproteobacteria bacterium]|nr:amidase [Gammaproteobacteria bacterium]
MALHSLSITDAVAVLGRGEVSAEELVADCLKRIEEYEPTTHAWAHLDPEFSLSQARSRDAARRRGRPLGRLHGVPIGIKDIIDTARVPTEWGCSLFSGRVPMHDAWLVQRLRDEGAVIMGKTVTTEMATFAPGKTCNPHNAEHTPGGSSSGSAASVAAYMVPGAIGSQTNGSVIRPASFCGVIGFKPSYGLIPTQGVLKQSPFLDHVGVFARSLADTALLAETIIGSHTENDSIGASQPTPPLSRICNEEPPMPPRFAFVRTARWQQADKATREGFEQMVEAMGNRVDKIELPALFESVWDWQKFINEADIAANYSALCERGMDKISSALRGQIESGRSVKVVDYLYAQAQRAALNAYLAEVFDEYDALITPAAIGEAPKSLDNTGDPVFCTPWTFCGLPALSLPLLQSEQGLPVGVQLVGRFDDDGRLLRTARWLQNELSE